MLFFSQAEVMEVSFKQTGSLDLGIKDCAVMCYETSRKKKLRAQPSEDNLSFVCFYCAFPILDQESCALFQNIDIKTIIKRKTFTFTQIFAAESPQNWIKIMIKGPIL